MECVCGLFCLDVVEVGESISSDIGKAWKLISSTPVGKVINGIEIEEGFVFELVKCLCEGDVLGVDYDLIV